MIKQKLSLSRAVYLFDEIKTSTVLRCMSTIQQLVEEDGDQPITLVINSAGGDVYDGLALIGALQTCPVAIHTVSLGGRVMSMALPIFLCGERRVATCLTTFNYHSSIWELGSDKLSVERYQQEIHDMDRIDGMIDQLIMSSTKIDQQSLKSFRETGTEWYIPAEQALQLGIIHEIA